jgi:hypothetical protein
LIKINSKKNVIATLLLLCFCLLVAPAAQPVVHAQTGSKVAGLEWDGVAADSVALNPDVFGQMIVSFTVQYPCSLTGVGLYCQGNYAGDDVDVSVQTDNLPGVGSALAVSNNPQISSSLNWQNDYVTAAFSGNVQLSPSVTYCISITVNTANAYPLLFSTQNYGNSYYDKDGSFILMSNSLFFDVYGITQGSTPTPTPIYNSPTPTPYNPAPSPTPVSTTYAVTPQPTLTKLNVPDTEISLTFPEFLAIVISVGAIALAGAYIADSGKKGKSKRKK